MNCTWTYNFCNYHKAPPLSDLSCLALSTPVFRVCWNLVGQLEILWSTPQLWRCLWPASVNEFFLFFLHCARLLILPWVRVSLSLYVPLARFPPHASSPHSLHRCFSLSLSLLLHVSLVYLFFPPSIGLSLSPILLTLWYLVLAQAFPQEWANLMINALSLLQHTDTLTLTPNWHGAQRSAQRSCLPTNYHTASTTLPPVSTPQPPTYVPLTLNLFMSFFHYIPPFEQSAFITFNYPLCQSSPSGHIPLIVLHIQLIDLSSNTSLPFSNLFSIIAFTSLITSFFLYNNNNNNNTHIFVCLSLSSTPEPIQHKLLVLCSN